MAHCKTLQNLLSVVDKAFLWIAVKEGEETEEREEGQGESHYYNSHIAWAFYILEGELH